MSEPKPYYKVEESDTDWSEAAAARFDGASWLRFPIAIGVDHPHYQPPLDPQQPTPEDLEREIAALQVRCEQWKLRYESALEVVDAARLAADDIGIVCRHWGYIQTYPLTQLRALLDVLTPPAPAWQAQDGDE